MMIGWWVWWMQFLVAVTSDNSLVLWSFLTWNSLRRSSAISSLSMILLFELTESYRINVTRIQPEKLKFNIALYENTLHCISRISDDNQFAGRISLSLPRRQNCRPTDRSTNEKEQQDLESVGCLHILLLAVFRPINERTQFLLRILWNS